MLFSRYFVAFLFLFCGLVVGCGGSNEPTVISDGELQQYIEENADDIAEQERIDEMEEQAEEEEEDEEE
ncbi:MAG: hypothetical protein GY904_32500 [Planctomycetaceae bacterium]|jgi:hypothetical protein|nr:hypothetical protein [Planctomycetaceae bacterium]